jgi:type I restriction enzyme S subunit
MRLDEVCESVSLTFRRQLEKVVLINTSDVLDGKVTNHTYVPNENLRGQFKKSFQRNDILFSEIRPKNRRFAFVTFDASDYVASTKLMVIRVNDKVIPEFLFQVLKSDEIINQLQLLAETRSGTFPQITFSELAALDVRIPSIAEQCEIATTLQALDNKIECNSKINHHLEQMAQAIFKSWFVDLEPFGGVMPDDWREGTLSEIATITMGQSPDGSSYNEDGIGTVFYQGRAEFGSRFPTRRLFTTQPKRMAAKGDVLMSVRAPVGDVNVAYESCCLGRGLAGIQSNNSCQSFILYTMFALKQQLDMFNGEGTVFGSINKNDMATLPVLIPSDEVLRQFEELVNPMDATIEANYAESCNLQAARDSLLPRLMSGELSVADLVDTK